MISIISAVFSFTKIRLYVLVLLYIQSLTLNMAFLSNSLNVAGRALRTNAYLSNVVRKAWYTQTQVNAVLFAIY